MIPHNLPTIGLAEQAAAQRVLMSKWVAQGKEVESFENDLCAFLGLPDGHAVVVSSGSSALYLSLWALQAQGKRIGLPVYACSAIRNAVGFIGGMPIYVDCGTNSPNIDMRVVNEKNLHILVVPSMFGLPAEVPIAPEFCIIEDIAQALGARTDNRCIGLRGDIGICSFYATKLITSGGQGGAVVSRDKSIIDSIRDYRQFDCRNDTLQRFNFQLTDLQAAIGREQLKQLPDFILHREKIYSIYKNGGLDLIDSVIAEATPIRYRAIIRCRKPLQIIAELKKNGIRAIVPVEQRELLDSQGDYPEAAALCSSTVSLPIYPQLTEQSAEHIAEVVRRAV